jgi:HK97 family phage prohead protease
MDAHEHEHEHGGYVMKNVTATEVRKFGVQLRATGNRTMVGLAVPYNATRNTGGGFTERFFPGVFAKSIKEAARALPLLMHHDWDSIPVGKAIGWEETAEGLVGTWQFDSRFEAAEAARLAHEGYLSGLSVGFLPTADGSDWDLSGDMPHVDRRAARLVETSLTPTPVFEGAGVIAVRSLGCPDRPETRVMATPRLDSFRSWLATVRDQG